MKNSAQCVWAKIVEHGQEPILVGCFYGTNREHTTNQIEELEKTLTHVQDNHNPNGIYIVLLGGDFNMLYINWETLTISSECNNQKMFDSLPHSLLISKLNAYMACLFLRVILWPVISRIENSVLNLAQLEVHGVI